MTMQIGWTTSSKESCCSIYNLLDEHETFHNPPQTHNTFYYMSAFQDIGSAYSGTFSNNSVVLQFHSEANSTKYKEGKKI